MEEVVEGFEERPVASSTPPSGDAGPVARAAPHHVCCNFSGFRPTETCAQCAHLRLHDAAPELLAALKEIVETWAGDGPTDWLMRDAAKLLAKLEGRS